MFEALTVCNPKMQIGSVIMSHVKSSIVVTHHYFTMSLASNINGFINMDINYLFTINLFVYLRHHMPHKPYLFNIAVGYKNKN